MNCKAIQKQILSYLDGELHGEMAINFEKHITECKNCQNEIERLKAINSIINAEKMEFKENPFLSARVLAKLSSKEVSIPKHKVALRYLSISGLAAAGVAIGIIIGTLFSSINTTTEITSTDQEWEQLANEYMPEVDNNPYNMVAINNSTNETPQKP